MSNTIHADEDTFKETVRNKHLENLQQLYALCSANIHIDRDANIAFRHSCMNGHLEVAKRLYTNDEYKSNQKDYFNIAECSTSDEIQNAN